ncbi:MAG: TRAP transporter small permease [Synergistaceae bacterium]|nr:TRAP transporter small permease [Synergistaceae bacterium]MBQ6419428.1 TRAP transporter small permease [Synergistaceae bacterium]MBQ9904492.1 TRAP transporter small permease [Synergistaceae bacterium]MBR0035312.1 TRAP transporter small permease [Synergistaceae bacterium]MBR0248247.1 TRAP transporter small permease [Synergistaceae bacterium]
MYQAYKKLMGAIVWIFTAIVYFSMIFIPVILSAQVIGRKFLNSPILGAEELAGFAFTAMVLFGSAVVCYRKKYIIVDAFVKGTKGTTKAVLAAVADVSTLSCYGVLLYCFYRALPALKKFRSGIFRVPKSVYAISLSVVFAFMLVCTIEYLIQDFRAISSGETLETKGSFE